jgi:hypothetical protein
VATRPETLLAELHRQYASDGFACQYTAQTKAWQDSLPLLQSELQNCLLAEASAASWKVPLEFPLYRLRRRVDLVLLTLAVVVVELKVGESKFLMQYKRQVDT